MKFLRNKTIKSTNAKTPTTSPTRKNQLLARSILASSKTSRIRRKPVISIDESPSNSQVNISVPARRLTGKTSSPVTPSRRSDEDAHKKKSSHTISKRKHSSSPVPHTPVTIKKRIKNDSSMKKTHSKRKERETEEEQSGNEEDDSQEKKSTVVKRKLNLDLSSK